MSGPQLDIDSIEATVAALTEEAGEGGTLIERDVPALCAEVRQLRQVLAAVEKLCSDPAYVFDVGVACIRVSDIRAALGAAVTPTPQETCEHGKTRPHFTSRELTAETYAYDCPGPVTSTPEAATEAPLVDCYEPCAACHGSGLANGINDVVSCYDCKGDGLVRRRDERGRFISASSNGDWTIADWEDWSNDLASLLPERYDNDVAQESLILDAVRDLVERDAASGLQRATEQPEVDEQVRTHPAVFGRPDPTE